MQFETLVATIAQYESTEFHVSRVSPLQVCRGLSGISWRPRHRSSQQCKLNCASTSASRCQQHSGGCINSQFKSRNTAIMQHRRHAGNTCGRQSPTTWLSHHQPCRPAGEQPSCIYIPKQKNPSSVSLNSEQVIKDFPSCM